MYGMGDLQSFILESIVGHETIQSLDTSSSKEHLDPAKSLASLPCLNPIPLGLCEDHSDCPLTIHGSNYFVHEFNATVAGNREVQAVPGESLRFGDVGQPSGSSLPDTPVELNDCQLLGQFCLLGENLDVAGPFERMLQNPTKHGQNVFEFPDSAFSSISIVKATEAITLETPPSTPNQGLAPDATLQMGILPQRRARLGGVSTFTSAHSDSQFLQDIQGDVNVFEDAELSAADNMTSCVDFPETELPSDNIVVNFFAQEELYGLGAALPAEATEWDSRLSEAWLRSQGSRRLEPLLKEELRLKIMKKRLDNGEEELDIHSSKPPKYQMTEQEHARRAVRRDQNRGAARRFRQKKKEKETEMKRKIEENEEKKKQLTSEVEALRREVAHLQELVNQHQGCGLSCLRL